METLFKKIKWRLVYWYNAGCSNFKLINLFWQNLDTDNSIHSFEKAGKVSIKRKKWEKQKALNNQRLCTISRCCVWSEGNQKNLRCIKTSLNGAGEVPTTANQRRRSSVKNDRSKIGSGVKKQTEIVYNFIYPWEREREREREAGTSWMET